MRRGKKKSDCEKYPLVALGQWELKRVRIDVLGFGRSPMLFFFFLLRKWKNCFPQKECRQNFLTTWHFVTNFLCYRIQVIQINFQLLIHFTACVCAGIWYHNTNNRYSRDIFVVRKFVCFSFWHSVSFKNCELCWVIAVATPLRKALLKRLHFYYYYYYYTDHNFSLKII